MVAMTISVCILVSKTAKRFNREFSGDGHRPWCGVGAAIAAKWMFSARAFKTWETSGIWQWESTTSWVLKMGRSSDSRSSGSRVPC
eukprot:16451826-Heterocapsa_arctica.AAC.1